MAIVLALSAAVGGGFKWILKLRLCIRFLLLVYLSFLKESIVWLIFIVFSERPNVAVFAGTFYSLLVKLNPVLPIFCCFLFVGVFISVGKFRVPIRSSVWMGNPFWKVISLNRSYVDGAPSIVVFWHEKTSCYFLVFASSLFGLPRSLGCKSFGFYAFRLMRLSVFSITV